MKLWLIKYDGVWLGGAAIVSAETEEGAIAALITDPKSCGAKGAQAKHIIVLGNVDQVIYNDNGDY